MMKTEEIRKLLQTNSEVSAYEIETVENEGRQLYFVMGKLETSRVVNSEEIQVTVYHDFEEYRGSSSFNVVASDDAESILKKTEDCIAKAKKVKNPYYPLAQDQESVVSDLEKKVDTNDALQKVSDAIFDADHFENQSLNAVEIFMDIYHFSFLNSNGISHRYDKVSMFIEAIPSYKGETGEYELYYSTRKGNFSADDLQKEMEEALKNVRYRAEAKRIDEIDLPKDIPVYVKEEMTGQLMWYFADQLSYQNVYFHTNHFNAGDKISDKPFSLTLKGEVAGATASSPVDEHGLRLHETKVINHGIAVQRWGDLRYGSYLKEEKITGAYPVLVMDEYEAVLPEEFNQPHITILHFSAPQLDESSGYFGGEVRLALYENGDEVIPLSGFSISGNIFDAIKDAGYSEKTCMYNGWHCFHGPEYMILKHLSIH